MLDTTSTCSAADLASDLGLTTDTVRRHCAAGRIRVCPRLLPTDPWRIPLEEAQRLTQEGATVGAYYDKPRKRWRADVSFPHPNGIVERIKKDSPVNTRRAALKYAEDIRRELAGGTFHRRQPTTLNDLWDDFADWADLELKPSTAESYKDIGRLHLKPFFGRVQLAAIDDRLLVEYKALKVGAALSKKTINNHLACLHSLLSRAVAWDKLDRAPVVRLFKVAASSTKPFAWYSEQDFRSILKKSTGYWRAFIQFTRDTGLRVSEVIAVRWSDLDLPRGLLHVERSRWKGTTYTEPKSGHGRDVYLTPSTVAALKRHPRMVGCELVFHSSTGKPINRRSVHKGFARVCKNAGVKQLGPHALRHTCASHMVAAGVPLSAVQDHLGHADIKTTQRYAHLSPKTRREAVMALEAR